MILQAIRSALFYLYLFVVTAILAGTVTLFTLVPPWSKTVARACADSWMFMMRWGLRILVGIRYVVTGTENIPQGGKIVASKHMSDLDVVALYSYFDYPSFIAKSQLFKIPLFGSAMRALDVIRIDRTSGGAGMREMVREAQKQIEHGRAIFIFPEGTRRPPLAEPNYRFGVAKMYTDLSVPIVPIALNTGLFWGRNSLVLWPGTAHIEILPPIQVGLDGPSALKALEDAIEPVTTRLVLNAVDKGLSRPIEPDFRDRIAAARQTEPAQH